MKRMCIALMCLLPFILTGCKEKDRRKLQFSHHLHVVENEMECEACHGELKDGGWQRAGHKVCADCHEDVVASKEISEETCGFCHKQKNLNEISGLKVDRGTSGTFVHTEALKGTCQTCHENILNKNLKHVPDLSRRTLIEVMRDACIAGKECSACHVGMNAETPPGSHHADWTRLHGSRAGLDDAICSVCHTREEACRECHKSTRPVSHNTLWRTKTHGVKANWDRGKCQVCHEEDACIACHAETKPRSHKATWDKTHCYSCHTSEGDATGCAMCHKTGFDNHPDPHEAGWKRRHCDRCHDGGGGVQQCDMCHESSGHGDPHKGNWLDQHCDSCHQDGSSNCGKCHSGSSVYVHEGTWPPAHNSFAGIWDCGVCHDAM